MNAVAFIGALALAVIALEIGTAVQGSLIRPGRLNGASLASSIQQGPRRSAWEALLIAIFPKRFDPNREKTSSNVVELLRRAGYPYDNPGEFFVASIRFFTVYLIAGAICAGIFYMLGLGIAAPLIAGVFIFLGLTRPYANLRSLAKKRAEAMRANMLVGLATLESLLIAGTGVQDAMRSASAVGGPFCNLLALMVAQLAMHDDDQAALKAIQTVRNHVPDPDDVDMQLFLKDLEDFFLRGRLIADSISALRVSVHRNILEATERRAAVVLQRTSILGIFAVVGLIFSIILPFMAM